MARKNNSYLKNVLKSLTQAGFDAVTDFTPNVKSDVKSNIDFAKRTFAPIREKLNNSKINNDNFIVRETKELIRNATTDIKKGTIYNKKRENEARDKAFNKALGIEDMDFDNLFNDDESGGNLNINNFIMDSGADTDVLSRGLSTVANTTVSLMKSNSISFGTISKQLSLINEFHNKNTVPFYNNMTSGIDTINNTIRELNVKMESLSGTMLASSYKGKYNDNLLSQFFGSGVNLEDWKDIFAKKSGSGSFGDMKDIFNLIVAPELKAFKANPLGFLLKTGIKAAIPKDIKKSLSNIDELWETIPFLLQGKSKDWKKSDSKIKNILGNFFDLGNNAQPSYKKYDYAKGAVRWDGVSRRALTNTIPGYLSKILTEISSLTGNTKNRELLYDYESGKFVDRKSVIGKYKDVNKSFSGIDGEVSDFRNEVMRNAKGSGKLREKDQIDFMKKTEKALEKLVKSGRNIGSAELNEISDDKFVAQYIKDTYNKLSKSKKNSLNMEQSRKYVSYQDMLKNIVDEDVFQQAYDRLSVSNSRKIKETDKQKRERLSKKFRDAINENIDFKMGGWRDSDGNPFMEKVLDKVYEQLDSTDNSFKLDKNLTFNAASKSQSKRPISSSSSSVRTNIYSNNRGTSDFSESSSILKDIRDALLNNNSIGFGGVSEGRSDAIFQNIDLIKTNTDTMVTELEKVNANLTNVFAANVNAGETPPGTDGNTFIRNIINKVKNGDYKQAYQTILNKFSPMNMIKKQFNTIKNFKERFLNSNKSNDKDKKFKFGDIFGKAKDIFSGFGLGNSNSDKENSSIFDLFGKIKDLDIFGKAKGIVGSIGNAGKGILSSLFGIGKGVYNKTKGNGSKVNHDFNLDLGSILNKGKGVFSSLVNKAKGFNLGSLGSFGGLGNSFKDIFGKLSGIKKGEKEVTKVYVEGGNLDGIRNVVYTREKLSDMNSAMEQRSLFGKKGNIMGPNGSFIMRDADHKPKRKSLWDLEKEKDEDGMGILDMLSAADDISDIFGTLKRTKFGKKLKGSKLGKGVGKVLGKGKGILGKGKNLLGRGFSAVKGGKLFKGVGKLGKFALGGLGGIAGKGISKIFGKGATKGAAKGAGKLAMGGLGGIAGKGIAKGLGKGAVGGAIKGLGKGAAKLIPGAGLVLTGLFAGMDAFGGWKNAGETFGVENATFGQKVSSSLGSVLSGLTFGLLNKDSITKGLYKAGSGIGSLFGFGGDKDNKPGLLKGLLAFSPLAAGAMALKGLFSKKKNNEQKPNDSQGNPKKMSLGLGGKLLAASPLGASIMALKRFFTKGRDGQEDPNSKNKGILGGRLIAASPLAAAGMLFSRISDKFKNKDQTVPTNENGMQDAKSQRNEFNRVKNAKAGSVGGASLLGAKLNKESNETDTDNNSTAEKIQSPLAKPLSLATGTVLGSAATLAAKRQRDKEREEDAIFQSKLSENELGKGEKAVDPASRTAFILDKMHTLFTTGTFQRLLIDSNSPLLGACLLYLKNSENKDGEGDGEGGTGGGSNATGTFGGRGRLQYAPKAAVKDALNMIHDSESGGDPGKVSNTKGDKGGQSFGSYQFSRNMGSYKNLIKAFKSGDFGSKAKEWGNRLDAVYDDANASEKVWKEIAKESPQEFQDVQDQYWTEIYFERDFVNPLKSKTGFDVLTRSNGLIARAMSIANQFGPAMTNGGAGEIFSNAVRKAGGNSAKDKDILNNVQSYLSGRSWDSNINAGMHERFRREHKITLGMLNDYSIAEGIKTKGASVGGATFGGGDGSGIGAKALEVAMQQIGKPYVWAATGPDSFDCSGLMQYAYKKVGLDIPRVTYDQMKFGKKLNPKDTKSFQPGDLLFPHSGHVVMYAGNGKTVEAPQTGDVVKVRNLRPMKYASRPSTEYKGSAKAMNSKAGSRKLEIPKTQGDNTTDLPDKKQIIDTILKGRASKASKVSKAARKGSYSSASVSSGDLKTIAKKHSQGNENYGSTTERNRMIDNTRSAVNNNEVLKLLSDIKNNGISSSKFLGQILEIIAKLLEKETVNPNNTSTGNAFVALSEIASILRGE